jgi:signal transduction histidine kinase
VVRRQADRAKAPASYVLLRVTDTGAGTPAAKEGVFEPLYANEWDLPASGPTLSAVYSIVKQAGGWISIYSQPGVGSSIEIFLPCDPNSTAT